jgi:hypothetical protein
MCTITLSLAKNCFNIDFCILPYIGWLTSNSCVTLWGDRLEIMSKGHRVLQMYKVEKENIYICVQ